MKVFVAGATGALGEQLVPRLVDERARGRRDDQERGARQIAATGRHRRRSRTRLDPDAVGGPVAAADPDVIVHELTALSGSIDLRHFERDFAERRTGCGPRAPTTCSPPAAPSASRGSSPRATPAGRRPGRADR